MRDGIGANSRKEALYPVLDKDSTGQPLDGRRHRYVLRFYWPKQVLLDGKWKTPVVKRVS